MFNKLRAKQLNDQGTKLREQGKLDEAIQLFEQAAQLDPRWAVPLYNLGLVYKQQHKWAESLDYNGKATVRDRKDPAAWWNMGIAATALGRWDLARKAWRGFGIKVPDGAGPIDFPCGFGPIRLNAQGDAEVVWAHRIDPARARLASIPFPETGHRYQDIVLNDGAPAGYRSFKGQQVPVFNALQLLEASRFGTYVARVALPEGQNNLVETLAEAALDAQGSVEDWSTSIRIICRKCSEGEPHTDHDKQAAPPDGSHLIAVAATSRQHAESILSTWAAGTQGIEVQALDDALEPMS